eukprot:7224461-Pyramimonas_sp.AAC.1
MRGSGLATGGDGRTGGPGARICGGKVGRWDGRGDSSAFTQAGSRCPGEYGPHPGYNRNEPDGGSK